MYIDDGRAGEYQYQPVHWHTSKTCSVTPQAPVQATSWNENEPVQPYPLDKHAGSHSEEPIARRGFSAKTPPHPRLPQVGAHGVGEGGDERSAVAAVDVDAVARSAAQPIQERRAIEFAHQAALKPDRQRASAPVLLDVLGGQTRRGFSDQVGAPDLGPGSGWSDVGVDLAVCIEGMK